jgi:hypothetical protein
MNCSLLPIFKFDALPLYIADKRSLKISLGLGGQSMLTGKSSFKFVSRRTCTIISLNRMHDIIPFQNNMTVPTLEPGLQLAIMIVRANVENVQTLQLTLYPLHQQNLCHNYNVLCPEYPTLHEQRLHKVDIWEVIINWNVYAKGNPRCYDVRGAVRI